MVLTSADVGAKIFVFCFFPTMILLTNSLTFTTLWANSDDKLMIFFLFFPENRIRHFMQTVFIGDNLHEMSKPVFWEK